MPGAEFLVAEETASNQPEKTMRRREILSEAMRLLVITSGISLAIGRLLESSNGKNTAVSTADLKQKPAPTVAPQAAIEETEKESPTSLYTTTEAIDRETAVRQAVYQLPMYVGYEHSWIYQNTPEIRKMIAALPRRVPAGTGFLTDNRRLICQYGKHSVSTPLPGSPLEEINRDMGIHPYAEEELSESGFVREMLMEITNSSRAFRACSESQKTDILKSVFGVAKKFRLDPFFLAAFIFRESRFDVRAVSPVGARGILQIMPATAATVSQQCGLSDGDLFNVDHNLAVGLSYLSGILLEKTGRLNGSQLLRAALQQYNGAANDSRQIYANNILASYKKFSGEKAVLVATGG